MRLIRWVQDHLGLVFAAAVTASGFLVSVGYELYYAELQTTPGQSGYSATEVTRTALTAAAPLIATLLVLAVACLFLSALWLNVMLNHHELVEEEGAHVAFVVLALGTLGAAFFLGAYWLGATWLIGIPAAFAVSWAFVRRTRRLGWAAAFHVDTFRRHGGRLWVLAIMQSGALFGAFAVALWLIPSSGSVVVDWWLLPVVFTAPALWPVLVAWRVSRLERRGTEAMTATRTLCSSIAALLALVLLAPAPLGYYSGRMARAGIVVNQYVPGFGAPRTRCVHVRWDGEQSPLPVNAVIAVSEEGGVGRWFDPYARTLVTQPLARTSTSPTAPENCRPR